MFFLSDQSSFLSRMNNLKKAIFIALIYSIPLICLLESPAFSTQESTSNQQIKKTVLLSQNNLQTSTSSTGVVRRGRVLVKKTGSIKPQYESCKGKNIYKLNSEFQDKSHLGVTEAIGPCIECAMNSASVSNTDDSLEDIQQALETENRNRKISRNRQVNRTEKAKTKSPYQAFKDQLRARVLGQVKTKVAQTQILQKCTEEGNIEKHRGWFTKRFPKVDWPLMKALCEKKKKDFHTSIEQRWPDMRVSLALTSANPDQVITSRPNLSFPLSHEVSDFGSMSKLTKEEQLKAKERWAEHLSKVPLDKLSPEQLTSQFIEGKPLRQASTKDLQEMRRATWELNKQSQARYRKHIEEMPLMGYMKTGDPSNEQDMDQTFSKYMGHLDDLLAKVKDKNVDMALLLSFGPLVEGLLKDNAGYCLAAEGERLKAERGESLKMWSLVAAGVVAAVPCFMTAGAVCLGLGVLVGAIGYKEAKGVAKEGLERFLTGREFETLASLSEKNSAAFWELMLLPLAAWGTTAGTLQTAKQLLKKGASAGKQSSDSAGSSKSALRSSTPSGNNFVPTITESYEETLGRLAKSSLEVDNLSPQQIKALENYHSVVRGGLGTDGELARAGTYTIGQRRKIIRFLESKGFSREQVRTLIEDGVVEVNRLESTTITRRVLGNLKKGKTLIRLNGREVHRISRILQETNNGVLVETERVHSGEVIKGRTFFVKEPFVKDPVSSHRTSAVLEKTDSGFVVRKTGMRAFFSFEEAIKNRLLPKNPTAKDYHELENVLSKFFGGNLHLKGDLYSQFKQAVENSTTVGRTQKIELYNPELEAVLLAAQSTRKRISSSDLNLSPTTNMEAQLAEQGYRANYAGEIDQINEWSAVRRRLQELRANPETTHIDYFADKVEDHIAYIREGLKENYSVFNRPLTGGTKSRQLRYLDTLEQEAKQAISDEGVTYKWWLEFNAKLSRVMSGRDLIKTENPDIAGYIQKSINHFPLKIVMPSTKADNIGIMAFNRAGVEGVYPAGLINRASTEADGVTLNAEDFYGHDFFHSEFSGNKAYLDYPGHNLFHRRVLRNIEHLPPQRRKKVESVYFTMGHENTGQNISYNRLTRQEVREKVIEGIGRNVARLFKFPRNASQKKKKIEGLADSFMEVYDRAQQHQ